MPVTTPCGEVVDEYSIPPGAAAASWAWISSGKRVMASSPGS